MYEDAQGIIEYLPIRRSQPENEYINHLWQAFSALDGTDAAARPFAVMPFHLLFMLAVQYKVLQIEPLHKQATSLFFTGIGGRNREQLLSDQKSVFDIALINERTIPDIFQLVEMDPELIKKFKELVDERNDNLAHAKGGIERDLENKINSYLTVLKSIQKCCSAINKKIATEWVGEISEGDDLSEYIETYFFNSRLSQQDFGDVIGTLLEAEQLDFDQWTQIANKGLEFAYNHTVLALQEISKNDLDEGKRFNAKRILQENGVEEELSLEEAQDFGLI